MGFKTDRDVSAVNEDVQMTTGMFIVLFWLLHFHCFIKAWIKYVAYLITYL